MFKVIQVKIQEQASCKKEISELLGSINQKTGSINRNTYLQNSILAQTLLKCIGFQGKHY